MLERSQASLRRLETGYEILNRRATSAVRGSGGKRVDAGDRTGSMSADTAGQMPAGSQSKGANSHCYQPLDDDWVRVF